MPDPRQARGKQLEWTMILGVIADSVHHHQALLIAAFHPARHRMPSEATIRRALRHVDIAALEQQVVALMADDRLQPATWSGTLCVAAVDGKYARGAGVHGQPTLLVSLVQHTSGRVLS